MPVRIQIRTEDDNLSGDVKKYLSKIKSICIPVGQLLKNNALWPKYDSTATTESENL